MNIMMMKVNEIIGDGFIESSEGLKDLLEHNSA
jgi:hypothetical protein